MPIIKLKRGNKSNLPSSGSPGEPFFAETTSELFIANSFGTLQEVNSYESNFSEKLYNADKTASYNADSFAKGNHFVDGNVYSPTVSNAVNIVTTTTLPAFYIRIGSIVIVTGYITIENNSNGAVSLNLSLPVASNLGNLFGFLKSRYTDSNITNEFITADTANDKAKLSYNINDVSTIEFTYTFTYKIL